MHQQSSLQSLNSSPLLPPIKPILTATYETSGNDNNLQTVPTKEKTLTPMARDFLKYKLNEASTEDICLEISRRMERLNVIDDYSTEICSDDLDYLRVVAKFGKTLEIRDRFGREMSFNGLPELFRKIWARYFDLDFVSASMECEYQNMTRIMVSMWNMTDKCTTLCKRTLKIALHRDLLKYLSSDYLPPSKMNMPRFKRIVNGQLGTLHNTVQRIPEARETLRDDQAVKVLQRYRAATDEMIACKALIIQAYLITEEENETINSDDKTFNFMLKILASTMATPEHCSRFYGFWALDVISAFNRLAANDNNKVRIVSAGALPYYVKLLQPDCSPAEQSAAALGIWTLAFKCKGDIENEPGCLDALQKLSETSRDESVNLHTKGCLWILRGKQWQSSEPPDAATANVDNAHNVCEAPAVKQPTNIKQSHVFISYQWDSKPTVLKIRDSLKSAGYLVWVDVDRMSGSVLEAMAEAVEKAIVVIVCLTQKYKESPNCRTGFDGSLLVEFIAMKDHAPETFYSTLKENNFSIQNILRVTKAMNQLQ